MSFKTNKGFWAIIVALTVILIDQVIKIWVKTSFFWGEDMEIFSWFHLKFIQNNGMAFGMEMGPKLFLTLFRIVVVIFLIWYLIRITSEKDKPLGYIITIALITAGAAGNIIDCVFYGEIFTNPIPPEVATFVPWGEGYASLFHGLVVDMFYFPLFEFVWPQWLPWVGGDTFSFFDPVFNFADASICVGIFVLLIKYYRFLGGGKPDKNKVEHAD
ncbi:MAG: lipoprotein signal peptidase [Muribaculaceae bacterium]|nr:lipoprotein signal peptidase [Muribaculaceae bacterium]